VGWDFFGGAWLGLIIDTIVCEGLFQNSEVNFCFGVIIISIFHKFFFLNFNFNGVKEKKIPSSLPTLVFFNASPFSLFFSNV